MDSTTIGGAPGPARLRWHLDRAARKLLIVMLLALSGCSADSFLPDQDGPHHEAFAPDFTAQSLPVAIEPRPGPELLYWPRPRAPQFENTGIWQAAPILISGASAYRAGEFLYQDYLFDDHGAAGALSDPEDPRGTSELFARPAGTYTYPTDPVYAHNAADLVEFRVKPLAGATALRITLNSLKDPERVAFTVAIGDSDAPQDWPHGAKVRSRAMGFLTVHGSSAEWVDVTGGEPVAAQPTVSVDLARRQFDIRLPHAAFDPGRSGVRFALGVGLWDTGNGQYLLPQHSADGTRPGGAGVLNDPPAFFNMAFRFDEPLPWPGANTQFATAPAWWRDRTQADVLATGEVEPFVATIDFGKLADRIDDDMLGHPQGVPQRGVINRILASRFETEQGAVYPSGCGGADECRGSLRGNLQPYALYVPDKPMREDGYGLTLLLTAAAANFNQYAGSRNQSQLGERGDGHIVVTPQARGPDGEFVQFAAADVFEVWADVARHYRLNPARVAVTGYSSGGYGTFKFVTRYPDLFGAAHTNVGPPAIGDWIPPQEPAGGERSNTADQLEGFRHVPVMMWAMIVDELVPYPGPLEQARRLDALGYRYVFDSFPVGEHLTLALNDEYAPVADFLGEAVVLRDPAHVSYAVNPAMDFPELGLVGDHAYWLSAITVRDASRRGTIEASSHGFGLGEAEPAPTQFDAGALTGGALIAVLPFTRQSRSWGAPEPVSAQDRLEVRAINVGAVTIHPARARVSCSAALSVESDGPISVTLAGCDRTQTFGAKSHS